MSPCIVTVRRTSESHDGSPETRREAQERATSRRAVATLEEAQAFVSGFVSARTTAADNRGARQEAADQLWNLPESGGTVGPLPDGTVIEVERVLWSQLGFASKGHEAIIAAYNEAHHGS